MSLDTSYSDSFKQENIRADLAQKGFTHESWRDNADVHSSPYSAVSWGAVLAGAVAAAALSLILIILGVGFGMSSISVWSGQGISAMTLGFTSIAWLAFTQIIAYGMGGYLAGRLRTKWVSVHTDEVYFRDTAHGFLTWALASLLCATLLTSVIGAIVGGAAKTSATLTVAASAAITGAASNVDFSAMGSKSSALSAANNPLNYTVSTLFRKDGGGNIATNTSQDNLSSTATSNELSSNFPPAAANVSSASSGTTSQTAEVASIFVNNMNAATLPPSDVKYAGQLVSQQTGITQEEAEKRVAMTFATLQEKKMNAVTQAKDAADTARRATAYAALWFFIFLLVGAFSASLAATWGGKSRDN